MNRGSVSRVVAACDLGDIRRSLPSGGRGKGGLVVLCLAIVVLGAMIFASTILLWTSTCEATNAGCNGAPLYPAGHPTRVVDAQIWGTTHRATPTTGKVTTHRPLIAGKHHAYFARGAG